MNNMQASEPRAATHGVTAGLAAGHEPSLHSAAWHAAVRSRAGSCRAAARMRASARRTCCEEEGAAVYADAALAAHVLVHLHRLGGVDVHRAHELARFVRANGYG